MALGRRFRVLRAIGNHAYQLKSTAPVSIIYATQFTQPSPPVMSTEV